MTRTLALTGVALFALATHQPNLANAECGGGGSGDGGSSGDSGGSSGDGGYCDSEPKCVETSPVVGYSECRRFGSWDASRRPALRFSIGSSLHRLGAGSIDIEGTADHPDMFGPATYSVVTDGERGGFVGGSIDLQITAALGRGFYAGLETQFGSLSTGPLHATSSEAELSVTPTSVAYGSAAVVGGVQIPLGTWDLRGEMAAGGELFVVSTETRHDDCKLDKAAAQGALLLRPRAVVSRWLSPWVSVGAGVGSNLLRRGDASASLFIGGHLRAFDGGR